VIAIGDLVTITKGKKPVELHNAPGPGRVRLLQIDDLRPGATEKYAPAQNGMVIARPSDIVIAWDGANAGTSSFGLSGAIGSTLAILRPRRDGIHTGFLGHFVRASQPLLRARAKGATVPHLDPEVLQSLPVSLPPLAEQRRIAAILDEADALRAKRRAALAHLDEMARAIFVEMFGDPDRNPHRWPVATLASMMIDGPQNGLYKPSSDYGNGTPILRIDSFYDGVVTKLAGLKRLRLSSSEMETYALRPGDIVVNRVNSMEYLGKSAIIPRLEEVTVFESNMMRFSVDRTRAEPRFVVEHLQTPCVRDQIRSAAKHAVNQSSINQQDVIGFRLLCPPIDEQKKFAAAISAVDAIRETERAALERGDALFASLQHRAFRGEL